MKQEFTSNVEVTIIGAGAAGMMCAMTAAQRGRKVLLLDHSRKLAEKIRISGGGRCNFTNLNVKPENYLSQNPHFCRSALARFTPQHFITLLNQHSIGYHQKTLGQLFCNDGSETIIEMLKSECAQAGVEWAVPCEIHTIHSLTGDRQENKFDETGFMLSTSCGEFHTQSVVIATGGLSIPKIGATPFGYKIAQQFGLAVTHLKPGLVPLSFHPEEWQAYAGLAGISLDAIVSFGKHSFRENLLFTHRGLSGPAILQISSYWEHGKPISINLLPNHNKQDIFDQHHNSRMLLSNFLAQYLPKRFVEIWCEQFAENRPVNEYSRKTLANFSNQLCNWQITPSGTLGYSKAEVTCGGVDTHALSSKTMEAQKIPGLFFIGEVVDVTGQLGGYNFQWAWASGYAAGQVV
jgi:hypothetical protein